ncbi:hypothetical protein PCS70012_02347, partial [Streptococcus pneumoniae PCS70012]
LVDLEMQVCDEQRTDTVAFVSLGADDVSAFEGLAGVHVDLVQVAETESEFRFGVGNGENTAVRFVQLGDLHLDGGG